MFAKKTLMEPSARNNTPPVAGATSNNDCQNEKKNPFIEYIEQLDNDYINWVSLKQYMYPSKFNDSNDDTNNEAAKKKKQPAAAAVRYHLRSILEDTYKSIHMMNNTIRENNNNDNDKSETTTTATNVNYKQMVTMQTEILEENIIDLITALNLILVDEKQVLVDEKKNFIDTIKALEDKNHELKQEILNLLDNEKNRESNETIKPGAVSVGSSSAGGDDSRESRIQQKLDEMNNQSFAGGVKSHTHSSELPQLKPIIYESHETKPGAVSVCATFDGGHDSTETRTQRRTLDKTSLGGDTESHTPSSVTPKLNTIECKSHDDSKSKGHRHFRMKTSHEEPSCVSPGAVAVRPGVYERNSRESRIQHKLDKMDNQLLPSDGLFQTNSTGKQSADDNDKLKQERRNSPQYDGSSDDECVEEDDLEEEEDNDKLKQQRRNTGPQYVGSSDDESLEEDYVEEEEDNDRLKQQNSGPQYVGNSDDESLEEKDRFINVDISPVNARNHDREIETAQLGAIAIPGPGIEGECIDNQSVAGRSNHHETSRYVDTSFDATTGVVATIVPNEEDIEATFQTRLSQERERMIGEAVMAEEVDNVEIKRKQTIIFVLIIIAILGTVIGLSVGLTGKKDATSDDDVIAMVNQTICYDQLPGQDHPLGQLCGPEETKNHGSGACNVVAKAFLEQTLTADFSILNAGLVNGDIAEGGFTRTDANILFASFGKVTLETLEVTGNLVVKVLNEALDFALNENTGAYPYGSGIRYDVNVNASVISNVEINPRLEGRWTPIDFDKRYTVVTTTLLAKRNDGYLAFLSIPDEMRFDTQVQTAKAFIDYVDKIGVIKDLPLAEYSTQYYGAPARPTGTTLKAVKEEGLLRCGIGGIVPGLSYKNDAGLYEGFEVDLCRAVAAAIFGDPQRVKFITFNSGEHRFVALTEKTVDLIVAQATHTMERDIYKKTTGEGYSFSAPYLYDGLGFGGVPPFGVCANNLDNLFGECRRLKICVTDETTLHDFLFSIFPESNIVSVPHGTEGFINGKCNAFAGESLTISNATLRLKGYTGKYEIGSNNFSKEPLAMVTREADVQWSDFVNSVLQSLLAAEKQNITQSNAYQFATTTLFGTEYENMFIRAIEAVGNYGEMYNRHLESILPRQTIDFINIEGASGLLYYRPFGGITTTGPGPIAGGTLERILDRGHLRCGITARDGFGELDRSTNSWKGLDADYCRAVSAGIFAGTRRRRNKKTEELLSHEAVDDWIVFVEHNGTDDGFISLANGNVDVLSGGDWNFQSEVMQPASGKGFTFSQVYFYDTSLKSLDVHQGSADGYTRALATRQDDVQWSDFVYFIVSSTFYADEHVITKEIANEFMPTVNLFGSDFESMLQNAIRTVGSYQEMYERNVETTLGTRGGRNLLNVNPFGP